MSFPNSIQLHRIPFSRRGAWLCLYRKNPGKTGGGLSTAPLSLRVLAGLLFDDSEVFDITMERNGIDAPWNESLRFDLLRLEPQNGGRAEFAFQDAATLRARVQDSVLYFEQRNGAPIQTGEGEWRIRANTCNWLLISALEGTVEVRQKGDRWTLRLDGEKGPAEVLIHRTRCGGTIPEAKGTLADCAAMSRADFMEWSACFPKISGDLAALRDRELQTIWNLSVFAEGNFKRDVVLVSKGSLVGLWSWDHCWHMLGTAGIDPVLSWNNLMAMFDHQDANGGLPDVMAANQFIWRYTKPPVHGWMIGLLESHYSWVTDTHREEAYQGLTRLTNFWLNERCDPKDGLPFYFHGIDSGWDNSTLFDEGVPLKTPDLATWLVLQQDWLARTAAKLGKADEAEAWRRGAQALLEKLLERFWDGNAFVARLMGSDKPVASKSLQLKIPLLLGHRLPEKARQWCLDGLLDASRYWTPFGLRSEPLESEKFSADGYWRGAVWPVTVFIFVEALRVNGFEKEADMIINGYLKHVEEAGNFENYRGDNGIGVRDTHFAWTATCVVHFLKLRS
ncbi:MAG: amylo-alpha-1,6-glucosidase [Chthoniobacteraceae bacterium]